VAVVLHVDDLAVPEAEDLEELGRFRRVRFLPGEPDDNAGSGLGDDLGMRVEDRRLGDASGSVLEDRPGLVGTVSARRVAPPQVAPGDATPVEVRVEQPDERFEVSRDGGVERGLGPFCVGRHGAPLLR